MGRKDPQGFVLSWRTRLRYCRSRLRSRVDDKLKKATIKRLLPGIVDGQPSRAIWSSRAVRRAPTCGLSGLTGARPHDAALSTENTAWNGDFDMSLDM
jgi:hypothetical protein